MHISWLGTTAVKLIARPLSEDVLITIDTYKPEKGNFPRSFTPNIALFTRGDKEMATLSGDPFILTAPGECEVKGVLISAIPGDAANTTILRLDAEQLSVGHLGLIKKALTNEQLEMLGGVDILFVPVGGGKTYDSEMAIKMINEIEPRIVIPMAFYSDTDPDLAAVDGFLKEMGASKGSEEKKVILKKKDLPTEDMQVIVLGKE